MSQTTEIIRSTKGSVLVGLLWCLALLTVVVVGVLHSANLDLLVVKNHGDSIQAHYLALAGIEKARALLHRDASDRKRSARHHSGELYNAPESFRDVSLGRGQFRVIRQGSRDEGGKMMFGVSDEESRLNVNQASADELGKVYGMTPDVVAAILDWRDSDNEVTPGGAEAEYYASLQPPYLPRNGPIQSTRELLMIRGVTRDLFLGEDVNQNGLLDAEEDDGKASFPPDNRDGILDAGWSGIVTVDSSVRNSNAAGQDRVDIKSADEKSLAAVRGITPELAKAIVAYRGQKQFDSLADLLEVAALVPQTPSSSQQNRPANQPGLSAPRLTRAAPAQNTATAQPSGPKLISEDLLMEIADDLTTLSGEDQSGAVNINTAGVDVLACLPGISQELARAIVSYRKSAGFFPNIAWLLKVDGMTRDSFKQAAPRVCVRSDTFRILSEGTVTSTGARKRIQVIVRVGSSDVETLSYREDL
jgi:competence ComEA-like helix-hairpin-helix protein